MFSEVPLDEEKLAHIPWAYHDAEVPSIPVAEATLTQADVAARRAITFYNAETDGLGRITVAVLQLASGRRITLQCYCPTPDQSWTELCVSDKDLHLYPDLLAEAKEALGLTNEELTWVRAAVLLGSIGWASRECGRLLFADPTSRRVIAQIHGLSIAEAIQTSPLPEPVVGEDGETTQLAVYQMLSGQRLALWENLTQRTHIVDIYVLGGDVAVAHADALTLLASYRIDPNRLTWLA